MRIDGRPTLALSQFSLATVPITGTRTNAPAAGPFPAAGSALPLRAAMADMKHESSVGLMEMPLPSPATVSPQAPASSAPVGRGIGEPYLDSPEAQALARELEQALEQERLAALGLEPQQKAELDQVEKARQAGLARLQAQLQARKAEIKKRYDAERTRLKGDEDKRLGGLRETVRLGQAATDQYPDVSALLNETLDAFAAMGTRSTDGKPSPEERRYNILLAQLREQKQVVLDPTGGLHLEGTRARAIRAHRKPSPQKFVEAVQQMMAGRQAAASLSPQAMEKAQRQQQTALHDIEVREGTEVARAEAGDRPARAGVEADAESARKGANARAALRAQGRVARARQAAAGHRDKVGKLDRNGWLVGAKTGPSNFFAIKEENGVVKEFAFSDRGLDSEYRYVRQDNGKYTIVGPQGQEIEKDVEIQFRRDGVSITAIRLGRYASSQRRFMDGSMEEGSPNGTVLKYDENGRLVRSSLGSYQHDLVYDAAGQLNRVNGPTGLYEKQGQRWVLRRSPKDVSVSGGRTYRTNGLEFRHEETVKDDGKDVRETVIARIEPDSGTWQVERVRGNEGSSSFRRQVDGVRSDGLRFRSVETTSKGHHDYVKGPNGRKYYDDTATNESEYTLWYPGGATRTDRKRSTTTSFGGDVPGPLVNQTFSEESSDVNYGNGRRASAVTTRTVSTDKYGKQKVREIVKVDGKTIERTRSPEVLDLSRPVSVESVRNVLNLLANDPGESATLGIHMGIEANVYGILTAGAFADLNLRMLEADTGGVVLELNADAAVKAGFDLKLLKASGYVGAGVSAKVRFNTTDEAARWLVAQLQHVNKSTGNKMQLPEQPVQAPTPTVVTESSVFGGVEAEASKGKMKVEAGARYTRRHQTFTLPNGSQQNGTVDEWKVDCGGSWGDVELSGDMVYSDTSGDPVGANNGQSRTFRGSLSLPNALLGKWQRSGENVVSKLAELLALRMKLEPTQAMSIAEALLGEKDRLKQSNGLSLQPKSVISVERADQWEDGRWKNKYTRAYWGCRVEAKADLDKAQVSVTAERQSRVYQILGTETDSYVAGIAQNSPEEWDKLIKRQRKALLAIAHRKAGENGPWSKDLAEALGRRDEDQALLILGRTLRNDPRQA